MPKLHAFVKDYSTEAQIFSSRLIILFLGIVFLLGVLLTRLYYLQIEQHDVFRTISDENRIQLQPIPPVRGLVYDRRGQLLADNRTTYTLQIIKERTENIDDLISQLAKVVVITDDDLRRFNKRLKKRRRPFEGVALKTNLTEQETARLAVSRHRFSGVEIKAELQRYYPLADYTAHSIGYVGRINAAELSRLDPVDYDGTNYIGKMGVEKFFENILHGEVGYQKIEADARGRITRILEQQQPLAGTDITLHLDANLQQVAYQAMAGRRGAVVALDTTNGGILTMISSPSYDPNLFVRGIDRKTYGELRDSKDIPLYNRALRGTYPPGSTIKPIVALAGLDTGIITDDEAIRDRGWFQLPGRSHRYRDWKKYGHGKVDVHQAIVQSCDTFFYEMAHKMGINSISDYLQQFGLGRISSVDLADELSGILPNPQWKIKYRGVAWYPGETIITAIGQGFMTTTPMQLATAAAVIANKGRWVRPRLLKYANGVDLDLYDADTPDPIVIKNSKHWDLIHQSMADVVHSEKGTAKSLEGKIDGQALRYKIAGKTGTAQVVAIAQDGEYDSEALSERNRDHALFVAFAPLEEPRIALAVIVENGEKAATTAGVVARKVMDAYLQDTYLRETVISQN